MKFFMSYFRLFCILNFSFCILHSAFSSEPTYTIARQIRYGFTLENTKNTPLEQGDFWVNIPLEKTATQWCLQVHASEEAGWITNSLGNRILHFKVELPPYGSRIVSITADLKLAPIPQPLYENLAGHSEQGEESHPQLSIWQRVIRYAQDKKRAWNALPPATQGPASAPSSSSNSASAMQSVFSAPADRGALEIAALAAKLKKANTFETARNIYQWVADNLKHSGYHKTDRGALWALKNKQGDCTEFASLFAALCRAAGIPTRTLSGFTCPRNLILKPYSLHNWAEFYDGKVWLLADPLERNFATNQSMYIAFAVLDGEQAQRQKMDQSAKSFAVEGHALSCPSNNYTGEGMFRYSGPGLVVKMNK